MTSLSKFFISLIGVLFIYNTMFNSEILWSPGVCHPVIGFQRETLPPAVGYVHAVGSSVLDTVVTTCRATQCRSTEDHHMESEHLENLSLTTTIRLFAYLNALVNFYRCSVNYWVYILFTYQQMHFLLNLEKFKFTLKYTYSSLLHVSVFGHPQGACTEPD